jgi:LysM repeat protein
MEIWLSNGTTDKIQLPVNPESIGQDDSSNFEDIVLASGDEKTVISGRNLKQFSISSFFPARRIIGLEVESFTMLPVQYVGKIEQWMNNKKIIQLQVTTTRINLPVTIRSFKWEEKGGSVGDIEYTIELKEYKPVAYSTIKVATNKPTAPTTTKRPPSTNEKPKTYTVKAGDNLWDIAKKYYGTGTKKDAIYNKNKSIIGKNPNLIRPGQKLVLP